MPLNTSGEMLGACVVGLVCFGIPAYLIGYLKGLTHRVRRIEKKKDAAVQQLEASKTLGFGISIPQDLLDQIPFKFTDITKNAEKSKPGKHVFNMTFYLKNNGYLSLPGVQTLPLNMNLFYKATTIVFLDGQLEGDITFHEITINKGKTTEDVKVVPCIKTLTFYTDFVTPDMFDVAKSLWFQFLNQPRNYETFLWKLKEVDELESKYEELKEKND